MMLLSINIITESFFSFNFEEKSDFYFKKLGPWNVTDTPGQCEPESNASKGVLLSPKSSRNRGSPADAV